jgi:hypothetical protein
VPILPIPPKAAPDLFSLNSIATPDLHSGIAALRRFCRTDSRIPKRRLTLRASPPTLFPLKEQIFPRGGSALRLHLLTRLIFAEKSKAGAVANTGFLFYCAGLTIDLML